MITTNACFPRHMPDFHQEFAPLDVASYDNYPPVRLPEDPEESYSNAFALDFVRGFKGKNFWILEQLGGPMGCWQPITPAMEPGMLEGYKVVIVPTHFITDPDVVSRLEEFAHKGGTVVVTCRSGVKGKDGNCILGQELPTLFRNLCSCRVTEYDAIGPAVQELVLERGGRDLGIILKPNHSQHLKKLRLYPPAAGGGYSEKQEILREFK